MIFHPPAMTINKQRGERIREARKSAFRSQEALVAAMKARDVGVSRGAVGNWELGGGIETDHLALIAELTGHSLQYLLSGKQPKRTTPRNASEAPIHPPAGLRLQDIQAALFPNLPALIGIENEQIWNGLVEYSGDLPVAIAQTVAVKTGLPLGYIQDGDTSDLTRDQAASLLEHCLRHRGTPKS